MIYVWRIPENAEFRRNEKLTANHQNNVGIAIIRTRKKVRAACVRDSHDFQKSQRLGEYDECGVSEVLGTSQLQELTLIHHFTLSYGLVAVRPQHEVFPGPISERSPL